MMIFQTFKVFETWVVLVINELDYPSFENFESHRILGQPGWSLVQISIIYNNYQNAPRNYHIQ